jgi:hypothetical protein
MKYIEPYESIEMYRSSKNFAMVALYFSIVWIMHCELMFMDSGVEPPEKKER